MDCPIIPAPISCVQQDGQLDIGNAVAISCSGECQGVADLLVAYLRDRLAIAARMPQVGRTLLLHATRASASRHITRQTLQHLTVHSDVTQDRPADVPTITLDCSAAKLSALEGQPLAHEGYELTISGEGIVVRGVAAAGVFYGVQSLLQLLPAVRDTAAHEPIMLRALTVQCRFRP
jgi:Glycosyl hydrolase family 20, domain 2